MRKIALRLLPAVFLIMAACELTDETTTSDGTNETTKKQGCKVETLSDSSGIKVVCAGEFSGIVYNGRDGIVGEKGEKGDKGDTSTISVGNVSEGTTPSVTNVGTPTAAIFDFVIPKGAQGPQGNPTIVNGKTGSSVTLGGSDIALLNYSQAEEKPIDNGSVVNEAIATLESRSKALTLNIFKPSADTTTVDGVTLTNNGDGTYNLSGTATALVSIPLGKFSTEDTFQIIGLDDSVDTSKVWLTATFDNNGVTEMLTESGSYAKGAAGVEYTLNVVVSRNHTVNTVVKPMVTSNLSARFVDYIPYTGNTNKMNELVAGLNSNLTVKQKVLTSGQTTVIYTDNSIDSNACFDWYADKEHQDLLPSDWEVNGNTLTVTYDAQSEDVTVGVQIVKGVL